MWMRTAGQHTVFAVRHPPPITLPDMKSHNITMLGTGLIGMFYTMALHGQRSRDRVKMVYSRREERASQFAEEWDIPKWSTDLAEAIQDPDTDTVVIGLPNNLHEECVQLAADAGKAILCTKPLGRTAEEALGNLAYTRYVLEAGFSGDFLDLMAALAPCVLGYGEIGGYGELEGFGTIEAGNFGGLGSTGEGMQNTGPNYGGFGNGGLGALPEVEGGYGYGSGRRRDDEAQKNAGQGGLRGRD